MKQQQKGFTLIELLIVLALIAILAGIIIVVIKPAEIFKKGRDTKRQGDLRNVSAAIENYALEASQNPGSYSWPSNSILYFSVATTAVPAGWPATSSATSSPLTTVTGTNSTAVDGSGWLPLNLSSISSNNLSVLPLDPINSVLGGVGYFYSFVAGSDMGNYELAAKLESTSTMANDGGNKNSCGSIASATCLYEVGPGRNSLY